MMNEFSKNHRIFFPLLTALWLIFFFFIQIILNTSYSTKIRSQKKLLKEYETLIIEGKKMEMMITKEFAPQNNKKLIKEYGYRRLKDDKIPIIHFHNNSAFKKKTVRSKIK